MKEQIKNATFTQLSKRVRLTYPLIASIAIALTLSPTRTQTAWDPDYRHDQALISDASRQAATKKLFTAIETNDVVLALEAINDQADINGRDKYGETALMGAALKGHTDSVRLLLEHHASVNIQNPYGYTALICAAPRGHTESVRLLLEHHANTNIQNKEGYTALIWASHEKHTDIVRLLLEHHADTNIQNNEGDTVLMLATQNSHANIVEAVILYGADVKNIHSKIKNIPVEMQTTIENAMQKRYALETMLSQQNWDLETRSPFNIIQEFTIPALALIIADYANPYDTTMEALLRGAIKCYINNNIKRTQASVPTLLLTDESATPPSL